MGPLFFVVFFLFFITFSFSFSFIIFLKKKVSSFLFSCISFKYVLLLASGRFCVLTTQGGDSWDWVGPPARERFNSSEWGGGSSLVKTEPLQIVSLLLLWSIHTRKIPAEKAEANWQGSPRRRRTLHHRGLRKLALNSRRCGGARKMA